MKGDLIKQWLCELLMVWFQLNRSLLQFLLLWSGRKMTSCFTVAFVRDLLLSEHLLKPPHLPSHNLKGSLHSPLCFFGNWDSLQNLQRFFSQVIFKNGLQGDFNNQVNDVCVKKSLKSCFHDPVYGMGWGGQIITRKTWVGLKNVFFQLIR